MKKENLMTDSDLIDHYYAIAVSALRQEWLNNSSYDHWYHHIISLPEKEKTTYLISILDMEVYNGGFNQYFINGYGQFVVETIIALQKIKALELANLLALAYSKINSEDNDSTTFRKKLFAGEINELYDENIDLYLDSLSDRYTEYPDNIGILLCDYLRE